MSRDVDYIISECQKIARMHGWIFEAEPAILYPDNVTVRFIHPEKPDDIKIFRYNDLTSEPRQFVRNIASILSNEWLSDVKEESKTEDKDSSYRNKLIEQIKAAGQDLIDRAESFVAADLKMIGGFNICIDFPQDGPVEISTNMKTYSMNDKYYKDVVYYADNKPVLVVKGE